MSTTLGQALLALCEHATAQVFLVAPFIKEGVLKRLLRAIPAEPEVTIVTRWIPEEVAHGVCDLGILDLATERPRTRLLLHPCLHAKYYRVDSHCLVGSANLTATALGWCPVPNIEILLEASPEQHRLPQLEEMLLLQSITATESIRNAVAQAVERIRKESAATPVGELGELQESLLAFAWLPTCVSPEYLFKIYSEADTSALLTSAVSAGRHDLSSLAIMPGLSEDDFRRYVVAILDQTPVVQEISSLSRSSAITSETATAVVGKVMEGISTPAYDAETYWLALKKWLLHFFPDRYRVRAAVEVFEQARELP